MHPKNVIFKARALESEVAGYIEDVWNVSCIRCFEYATVDFFVCDRNGNKIAALEVKERNCNSYEYPETVFDAAKAARAFKLGLPVIIVIQWRDALMWAKLDEDISRYKTVTMRVTSPLAGYTTKKNLLIPVSDFKRFPDEGEIPDW